VKVIIVLHHQVIENISIGVISQMTHVFGLSEKNWQKSYADKYVYQNGKMTRWYIQPFK